MRKGLLKRLFSYLLIGCGASLLFLGARDVLESHFGQTEAAREFEQSQPDSAAPSNSPVSSATPAEDPIPASAAVRKRPPLHSLTSGDTLAKLIIPRLDTELYVVEGDGPKELRRGPGH